jgi:hypothetical protein
MQGLAFVTESLEAFDNRSTTEIQLTFEPSGILEFGFSGSMPLRSVSNFRGKKDLQGYAI